MGYNHHLSGNCKCELQALRLPHTNWLQLISVVLENGPQLLWKCYWREEAKILEQQGKAKGFETSQDQILVRVITLILRNRLAMMNTPCSYVAEQL